MTEEEEEGSTMYICSESGKCQIKIGMKEVGMKCQVKIYSNEYHPSFIDPRRCIHINKDVKWIPMVCSNCSYYVEIQEKLGGDYEEYCQMNNHPVTFDTSCKNWKLSSKYRKLILDEVINKSEKK